MNSTRRPTETSTPTPAILQVDEDFASVYAEEVGRGNERGEPRGALGNGPRQSSNSAKRNPDEVTARPTQGYKR